MPAAGGFAPVKCFQLKCSSVTRAPQCRTWQRVYPLGPAAASLQDLPCALPRPKADSVSGSKTFRPGTGQKCFLQQMSLDRAVLRHSCSKSITFPQLGASAQLQAVLPQHHHAAVPPSLWASCGQAPTTRSPLPCSFPGTSSQVCRGGGGQEAQASNVLDNISSDRASWSLARQPTFA